MNNNLTRLRHLTLLVSLSVWLQSPVRANDAHNRVPIMVDDMGYGDVSAMNPDSKISTPHIDRLAEEGMTFTDAGVGRILDALDRKGDWKQIFCPGSGGWTTPTDMEACEQGLPDYQQYHLAEDPGERHPRLEPRGEELLAATGMDEALGKDIGSRRSKVGPFFLNMTSRF